MSDTDKRGVGGPWVGGLWGVPPPTTIIAHASFSSYPQVLREFWYILRLSVAEKRTDANLIT